MDSGVTSISESERHSQPPNSFGEASSSGVSWGAVIGGAFVAAAVYLILLALGAGFGLAAVSPWSGTRDVASAVGAVAIVWLIAIEIISSALGGYLTGRLRTKWARIHTDEVFFRDTANGFLAWAVAVVASAAFLASAASIMVGNAERLRPAAESSQTGTAVADAHEYLIDTLLRSGRVPEASNDAVRSEVKRILFHALREGQISQTDQAYLAQLAAARTGTTMPEAEKRVADFIVQTRQAEDSARKVMAHLLLWLFLSLLMGAFSASFAATIGGRQRDHVPVV